MAYDKGQAAGVSKIAPHTYSVNSWKNEEQCYTVRLDNSTCTCPHFTQRLAGSGIDCKHLTLARAERYRELTETARQLPVEQLETLVVKHQADRAIWTAISGEIFDRTQAASRDAELRSIFA